MNVMHDADINGTILVDKRVAVIGFGSQGHAHALNLRDSGVDVIVGLRRDSASWQAAEAAGIPVFETAEAARQADIVMILIPDEIQPDVFEQEIGPNLRDGAYLAFAHGFAVHFGRIVPPENANVFLVAPKGPGHLVRRQYESGSGVPCLIAAQQDQSGDTHDVALAYAGAIGGGRAGILETSFREETETDLFGEQAVLCGGLTELVRAGFETLVNAGYAPEMAYFECLHEVKLITDLMYEQGITGMRDSISNTAEYGDLTRGRRIIGTATRRAMREVLDEIQSGSFADEWMSECADGKPMMQMRADQDAGHEIERVGRRLRGMMPWITQRGERARAETPPAPPATTCRREIPATPTIQTAQPARRESAQAAAPTTPSASAPRRTNGQRAPWNDASYGPDGCDWPGFEPPPCWYLKGHGIMKP